MALKAYALTTVARFKTFAEILTTDDDGIIEILINQVTEFVEKYCGRRFKKTAYTGILLDSDGGETLHLPQYPIVEGQTFTLKERVGVMNESSWRIIYNTYYFIDYVCGLVCFVDRESMPEGRQRYQVDYTAGYDFDVANNKYLSDTEAADLELAVWKLINEALLDRQNALGVKSESIADYSVTYADTVSENMDVKTVLDSYKREDVVGGGSPYLY